MRESVRVTLTATLADTPHTPNSAGGAGGGIVTPGTATVIASTFPTNLAFCGGGLDN